jgi:hypothetical protein
MTAGLFRITRDTSLKIFKGNTLHLFLRRVVGAVTNAHRMKTRPMTVFVMLVILLEALQL